MERQADPFEDRLEALFADPPPAADAETFALAVERRIADQVRLRRMVYGGCLAGAFIGALVILALAGGAQAMPDLAGADATAWLERFGPVLGAALLIWLVAELAPSPYRR